MRTARALVPLSSGTRPRGVIALAEAKTALVRLAGTDPVGEVRFVGFDSFAGTRVAAYEADFS